MLFMVNDLELNWDKIKMVRYVIIANSSGLVFFKFMASLELLESCTKQFVVPYFVLFAILVERLTKLFDLLFDQGTLDTINYT